MNQQRLISYIRRFAGPQAEFLLLGLGFALLLSWIWISRNMFLGQAPLFITGFVAAIAAFLWGCIGLSWALRQEAPQLLIFVKGKPAVVIGVALMLGWWGIAIAAIARSVTLLWVIQ